MKQVFTCLLMALVFTGCQTTKPTPDTINTASSDDALPTQIFAQSKLEPKSGSQARGVAWFAKRGDDIDIRVSVSNVTPGAHGIHLHEKGDCGAPDASSAGEHFNPARVMHGQPNPQVYHMGDLGNINVDQNGNGELKLTIPASQFHPEHRDWSVIIGKSVVLHQKIDDLLTQPSGNSGDRIACGVIVGTEAM